MKEVCTGFWEMCECEDCRKVAVLYAELDYYEEWMPEATYEIAKLKQEIEDMGYSTN